MKITKDNRYMIIEKFHNDTLSSEEIEAFYDEFDANPAFRDDVERMGILLHGLENLSEADKAKIKQHFEAEELVPNTLSSLLISIKAKIKHFLENILPAPIPSFAIAASVVVLILAGIYLFMNKDNLFSSEKNLVTEEKIPDNNKEDKVKILQMFSLPDPSFDDLGIVPNGEALDSLTIVLAFDDRYKNRYYFPEDTLTLYLENPDLEAIVINLDFNKNKKQYEIHLGENKYLLDRGFDEYLELTPYQE